MLVRILLALGLVAANAASAIAESDDYRSEEFWRKRRNWASEAMYEGGSIPDAPRYRAAHSRRRHVASPPKATYQRKRGPVVFRIEETAPRPTEVEMNGDRQHIQRDATSDVACWPMLKGRSQERASKEEGTADAIEDWRAGVFVAYGIRWGNWENANLKNAACFQSSLHQALRDKLGSKLWICEVEAKPCLTESTPGPQQQPAPRLLPRAPQQ